MANPQKKILIVDDDPVIIKLLQNLLVSADFEVFTATDGIDALVRVRECQPDLIVLDIMMPEINGYDVCSKLKFDSPYKDIPILLLTARDQEIDQRISQMMGIDYMQKPLDRAVFMSKVQQALQ